jgi:septal ring factor EnvC (AmiA/AmiB activator)
MMSEELEIDESDVERAKDFARIAAMHERIEDQRAVIAMQEDERVTLKARIAELEQKLANIRALVHEEQTTNNIILGQVARADRLAEAVEKWGSQSRPIGVDQALAAYRNG